MTPALRSEFKRKCNDYARNKKEAASYTALFEVDPEETHALTDDFLWRALRFPLQWVQVNALYELFKRHAAPTGFTETFNDRSQLSIIGSHSWDQEALAKGLEEHGIALSQFNTNTTHLILGINPPLELPDFPAGVMLVPEEAVAALTLQNPRFYLLQGDKSIEKGNLSAMLRSNDKPSLELAMGILSQGGLPLQLVTEIFTLYRSNLSFPMRQAARQLLLKYTYGTFKRNLLRKYFALKGMDQQLLKAPREESDPDHLLDFGLYLQLKISFSPAGRSNTENLVAFHKGLTNISGSKMLEVLESMEKENRLRFPKTATVLPPETYQLEHLKSIEIYHAPIAEIPEGIAKLPRLIRIWFNCPLQTLPNDLGDSKSIRMVNLFNAAFEEFPTALSRILNLKIFRWEYNLKGSGLLRIPSEFFHPPLNTVIIMEDEIEFPDSFYQLETLTSLAITYRSAWPLLEKIATMPYLQRLRLAHDEQESIDQKAVLEKLSGWKVEDQNERNVSFIKI